jgi:crossover junction endodeoxyribonuclease RuvC
MTVPTSSPAPIVLGIDPGLNTTGYGVVTFSRGTPRLVEAGVVRSTRGHSLERRIKSIHEGMVEVLAATKPDIVAIEQLFTHYDRPDTAILMAHARGVLMLAAASAGLEVTHWRPTQVKKILTGNGRAPKAQVQLAVARLLELASIPDPPDVADALAIAVCHCFLSHNRLEAS